jgi:hypothetical protein
MTKIDPAYAAIVRANERAVLNWPEDNAGQF